MKTFCSIFSFLFCLSSQAQTINVRLFDGVDSFQDVMWNNWKIDRQPDTSSYLVDIYGNTTRVRAVLRYYGQTFDNGGMYLNGKGVYPDTVLRKGAYNSGYDTIKLIGLDDSSTYTLRFFGSRNRTDAQYAKFSVVGIPADTATVRQDTNATKMAAFSAVPSSHGAIIVAMTNVLAYSYLNAINITGVPKHSPVQARIWVDSATIHYPRSYVKLCADSSISSRPYYSWSQASGPTAALFNSVKDTLWVSGLVPGQYRFGLTVQDSAGNTDTISVPITVIGLICPLCPVCPPPVVCPVPRTVVGLTAKFVGGQLIWVVQYSDGTTQ